jgi:hypothetical protein
MESASSENARLLSKIRRQQSERSAAHRADRPEVPLVNCENSIYIQTFGHCHHRCGRQTQIHIMVFCDQRGASSEIGKGDLTRSK